MTARILGWQLGLARAIGAILFSVIVGFLMHLIFFKEEKARHANGAFQSGEEKEARPLWKNAFYFASMVGVLVFANWSKSQTGNTGLWASIFNVKWIITAIFLSSLVAMLIM